MLECRVRLFLCLRRAQIEDLVFRLTALLLGGQVHDEVILEGPREASAEAQALVVACMENPFPLAGNNGYSNPLDVDLVVDSNVADTWYEAK